MRKYELSFSLLLIAAGVALGGCNAILGISPGEPGTGGSGGGSSTSTSSSSGTGAASRPALVSCHTYSLPEPF